MAQRKESHGEIDWSAAEVSGGDLSVPLTGEPSKAWTDRVAEVVERLKRGGGGWDAIDVGRKAIAVKNYQLAAQLLEQAAKEMGVKVYTLLGGWDAIEVGRKAIAVKGVQPGAESDLRHFLEGAVMQANADFAPDPQDAEDGGDEGSEADGEMTGAFRAFGEADGDGEDSED